MKKRKLLCFTMASLLLISSALFSFAEEKEEVQDKLKEVEEKQQEIEVEIEVNEMEESEIIEKIEEIEMEIIEAEAEIEGIESKILQALEEIEITQQELIEAKAGMGDKNELLGSRVAAMYRKGNISYIEIIFGSRNFSDLLSNVDMILKIADHDVQLIEELEEQVALVGAKQDILENQKNQLLVYQQDVEQRVEMLQVSRGTQQTLRQKIQSTIADMQYELREWEEESELLEGEIQRIEREIQERIAAEQRAAEERAQKEAEEQERLEAERKAKEQAEKEEAEAAAAAAAAAKEQERKEAEKEEVVEAAPPKPEPEPEPPKEAEKEEPVVAPSTNRSWPVPGYTRISSPYGYRTHPIFGDWRPHWGIDIPAPMGTPIVASLPGEVILSTYNGSYGNYVVIYHGDGISTLYAHNSQNHVAVGNRVERGQVIASIGSTGNSTGPHLHFEVRVNGDPKIINPLQWLNQ